MVCSRFLIDSNKKERYEKNIIHLMALPVCFASCMGDGYADPDNTIKVPAAPQCGDNNIKEKNVITIAQLKTTTASLLIRDMNR